MNRSDRFLPPAVGLQAHDSKPYTGGLEGRWNLKSLMGSPYVLLVTGYWYSFSKFSAPGNLKRKKGGGKKGIKVRTQMFLDIGRFGQNNKENRRSEWRIRRGNLQRSSALTTGASDAQLTSHSADSGLSWKWSDYISIWENTLVKCLSVMKSTQPIRLSSTYQQWHLPINKHHNWQAKTETPKTHRTPRVNLLTG